MKEYKASRLSEGNKVFPIHIIIDDKGVTLRNPGVFNSTEKTIPFSKMASVNIDTPLVGYSTIILQTTGEGEIKAHGFTKAEVTEIKNTILEKI